MKDTSGRFSGRTLLALLAFVLGLGTVPHRVCERDAGGYFDGDPARIDALAASVSAWTDAQHAHGTPAPGAPAFETGSRRYDGEWRFGTSMMAAMGFGQIALATRPTPAARPAPVAPATREVVDPRYAQNLARMERCLGALLAPSSRAFDSEAWTFDALASLHAAPGSAQDRGHVAYLGYAGLALGLHRTLVPSSRFAALHDAIVAGLARRIAASPSGLVETYPGEVYPVDNAAALAAIALHATATGRAPPRGLAIGLDALRTRAVQPSTGLLAQAVDPRDAAARDEGRGSGTALAAYFLAYADTALSASLYRAVHRELFRTVLGFGAVLEHSSTCVDCTSNADVDSGPVVFGFGVSATGFAIGASRVNDDRDTFEALYATAHLFGAPFDDGGARTFATGGPLGDAILLAMLTAPGPAALAKAGERS